MRAVSYIAPQLQLGMLIGNLIAVIGWLCLVYRTPTLGLYAFVFLLGSVLTIKAHYYIFKHLGKLCSRVFMMYLVYALNGELLAICSLLMYNHGLTHWISLNLISLFVMCSTMGSWFILDDD